MHPSQAGLALVPSARLPGAVRGDPAAGPSAHQALSVARTRVRAHRGLGHGRALAAHLAYVVRGLALHRGVRGAALDADRGRIDRSDPDHQLQDTDRRSRGGDVWLDPSAQTRPPPVGPRLPGGPPSAPARPLAARHIGRAALPSATFPHTLPAVRQVCGPISPALRRTASGNARQSLVILPPQRQSCKTRTNLARLRGIRSSLTER